MTLGLIDIGVRDHHRSELILATCLRVVLAIRVVGLLGTVNVHILWILKGIRVLRDLEH